MTITDLINLPVENRADAESFMRGLNDLGLMYHFDDGAMDCLYRNKLCTGDEAFAIDEKIETVYIVWEQSGADMRHDCPIGYALKCLDGKA